jgi:hypothetical protein
MRAPRVPVVAALVLLAGLTPGCIEGRGTDPGAAASFLAGLRLAAEREISVELGPPVDVLDREGLHRPAYELIVWGDNEPDDFEFREYINERWEVVRRDHLCTEIREGRCEYAIARWLAAGSLPSYGVGWLRRVVEGEGRIHYNAFDADLYLLANVLREGDSIVLAVHGASRPDDPHARSMMGRYEYVSGETMPRRFTSSNGGSDFVRTSYQSAAQLRTLPAWPSLAPPSLGATERSGLLFPGADADWDRLGFTAEHALAWLQNESARARGMLAQGGCTVHYAYYKNVRQTSAVPPLGSVLTNNVTRIELTLTDAGGHGATWTFEWVRTALESTFRNLEEEPAEGSPCQDARRSPWPTLRAQDFVATADSLVTIRRGASTFSHALASNVYGWNIPPEGGWDRYTRTYVPAFVRDGGVTSYRVYAVVADANHGWLEVVQGHPDDIRALTR